MTTIRRVILAAMTAAALFAEARYAGGYRAQEAVESVGIYGMFAGTTILLMIVWASAEKLALPRWARVTGLTVSVALLFVSYCFLVRW